MNQFLAQFLTMLMVKILNPDEDTKEIQDEIIANPDMVEVIAIREATDTIIKIAGGDENVELVADVIEVAKNMVEVIAIREAIGLSAGGM